jgi:hypothetical protein
MIFNILCEIAHTLSMRNLKQLLLLLSCCLFIFQSTPGFQPVHPKEKAAPKLRVLFIGNSYTYFNNLPEIFTQLSASARPAKHLEAQMITRGGATLKMNWEDGAALKALQQQKWDYVVLQEQSLLPINDPETMYKYARLFDAEIKKAGAKTIFYLTWARQHQPENQPKLNEAYLSIAKELGALIAPAGIAWQSAFKEVAKLELHTADQSHPNPAGSYLTACVLYAVMFAQSPEGLTGKIEGKPVNPETGQMSQTKSELVNLSAAQAATLQRIAWETVKNLQTVAQQHAQGLR